MPAASVLPVSHPSHGSLSIMSLNPSEDFLVGLVRELTNLPKETEWVEFKVNDCEPDMIGETVSALSNSAALLGKPRAYLVWGVENGTHRIVGTTFSPHTQKVGNEELENWLLRLLDPRIGVQFCEVTIDGKRVVLLEVCPASHKPTAFKDQRYARVGSYTKKLKEYPEKERDLWRTFDRTPFEDGIVRHRVEGGEVLQLIDYPSYFDLMHIPLPEAREGILSALRDDGLIRQVEAGRWDITALGAILYAKQLDDFHTLRRKVVRVVVYSGNNKIKTVREQVVSKGYASGFQGLIESIKAAIPSNEVIEKALRRTVPMYPEPSMRELVANALIHQDFSITGGGPMVEIFQDRVEITNPGAPLVATDRFLDSPPRSRNEELAAKMRRMGICEERGSGVDKVVFECELYQLPAPLFESPGDSTRVTFLAPRPLKEMTQADRIRATYLHACLRSVQKQYLTNSSLRERFGLEDTNAASARASQFIKEAVEAGLIFPYDKDAAPKLMKYVPWWARPVRGEAEVT